MGETVGRFVEAIHTLAAGGEWLPEPGGPTPGELFLGQRRLQIVRLLRDGCSTKALSDRLDLSISTIDFHIRSLKTLLRADTHAEIVAEAIRRGFVPPPGLDDDDAILTPRPS